VIDLAPVVPSQVVFIGDEGVEAASVIVVPSYVYIPAKHDVMLVGVDVTTTVIDVTAKSHIGVKNVNQTVPDGIVIAFATTNLGIVSI
jgi:hypothetical protein